MAWYWWVLLLSALWWLYLERRFNLIDSNSQRAIEKLKELESKLEEIEDHVRPPPERPDFFADEAKRKAQEKR